MHAFYLSRHTVHSYIHDTEHVPQLHKYYQALVKAINTHYRNCIRMLRELKLIQFWSTVLWMELWKMHHQKFKTDLDLSTADNIAMPKMFIYICTAIEWVHSVFQVLILVRLKWLIAPLRSVWLSPAMHIWWMHFLTTLRLVRYRYRCDIDFSFWIVKSNCPSL